MPPDFEVDGLKTAISAIEPSMNAVFYGPRDVDPTTLPNLKVSATAMNHDIK
jgi:hypothetical protein